MIDASSHMASSFALEPYYVRDLVTSARNVAPLLYHTDDLGPLRLVMVRQIDHLFEEVGDAHRQQHLPRRSTLSLNLDEQMRGPL